jgi:hypothetical protein
MVIAQIASGKRSRILLKLSIEIIPRLAIFDRAFDSAKQCGRRLMTEETPARANVCDPNRIPAPRVKDPEPRRQSGSLRSFLSSVQCSRRVRVARCGVPLRAILICLQAI